MSTARAGRTPGPRLSIDDWIELGFTLLAEEGLSGIKIDRLCARMGVTKGSFYWHFTDLQAYLDALAERWGEVRDSARGTFRELEQLEPHERLRRMMEVLADPRQWTLERAVREWARSEPRVAERVRASDRWVSRAVLKAFREAGFTGADAEVRARGLFYAGVGLLHIASERDLARGARERNKFLEILLRP
ncbi:MAG TPA: TetR/AcrR family transcriptional regulator [Solirubrobacteraceae bacterium]|nr:TetR/AcrR family transcriptional regulator [Solirubrobacteraceae bacterium]